MNAKGQCLKIRKGLDDGTGVLKESPPLTAAIKTDFLCKTVKTDFYFSNTTDSRRGVARQAGLLTKVPCKLAVPHDISRHACPWMPGHVLNSGCGLW